MNNYHYSSKRTTGESAEEVYTEIALKLQESADWRRRPAKMIQVLAAVRRMLELSDL